MIYVMLAPGFEEIEAVATIDVLRRAELSVTVVGVGTPCVKGAHDIVVNADLTASEINGEDMTAIVLPGGMPGTINLEKSAEVKALINKAADKNVLICAICAAPSILGHMGLLEGKSATCFPGFEQELHGAFVKEDLVVEDGKIITAKGAGAAIEFGIAIASRLASPEIAEAVRSSLQCR